MYYIRKGGITPLETTKELISLIEQTTHNTILEVGTYKGVTAHYLAVSFPDAEVYTINFKDSSHDIPDNLVGIYCRYDKNVTQIIGNSLNDETWVQVPNQVDVCYIDGDHRHKWVLNDTFRCLALQPKLILWHDAELNSVKCAMKEVRKKFDKKTQVFIPEKSTARLGYCYL